MNKETISELDNMGRVYGGVEPTVQTCIQNTCPTCITCYVSGCGECTFQMCETDNCGTNDGDSCVICLTGPVHQTGKSCFC